MDQICRFIKSFQKWVNGEYKMGKYVHIFATRLAYAIDHNGIFHKIRCNMSKQILMSMDNKKKLINTKTRRFFSAFFITNKSNAHLTAFDSTAILNYLGKHFNLIACFFIC